MKDYINPSLLLESDKIEAGSVEWRSPSNLAIVKYWGKHGQQLARNPSLSLTLSEAFTETKISYKALEKVVSGSDAIQLSFTFEGKEEPAFAERIKKYLSSLLPVFPFLKQLDLTIDTKNSFPHSSGIASSASAMSALALCLCSIEDRLFGTLSSDQEFDQKASYIARLGSGSACRSIYGHWSLWGETGEVKGSSDVYAIPMADQVHPAFERAQDAILIVSEHKKSVSSTQGHQLMETHDYASVRFQQARSRLHRLLSALRMGDWEDFGRIAENEALTLHGLMMSSNPSYMLMHPNTLRILNATRKYREVKKVPVYFSLDAGPNVHLLYPESVKEEVNEWIGSELSTYCKDGKVIYDHGGDGPEEL